MNNAASRIAEVVASKPGYHTGLHYSPEDLKIVRSVIREAWLGRIAEVAPQHLKEFETIEMDRYHEKAHLLDHDATWTKISRTLSSAGEKRIRATGLVAGLRKEFGDFIIADEEKMGWENMSWRLVRPGENRDVGSLHQDAWFWTLSNVPMPEGYYRVKVWCAVYCEPGMTGLRVVPNSHLKEWPYHAYDRDGRAKPMLDIEEKDLDIRILPTQPGDAVVFNDLLLHGGVKGGGTRTRVSVEFTVLAPLRRP